MNEIIRKRDPDQNLARFYVLRVQAELFGGWALIREWGRIGSPGQVRVEPHADLTAADNHAAKIAAAKRRKGYA